MQQVANTLLVAAFQATPSSSESRYNYRRKNLFSTWNYSSNDEPLTIGLPASSQNFPASRGTILVGIVY